MKNKTIKITEEFQIPGTDVILEAGDQIQLKEDYGWEIQRGKEWEAYEDYKEMAGADQVADDKAQQMGTAALNDALSYIFRNWDYRSPYLEGAEDDDDVY